MSYLSTVTDLLPRLYWRLADPPGSTLAYPERGDYHLATIAYNAVGAAGLSAGFGYTGPDLGAFFAYGGLGLTGPLHSTLSTPWSLQAWVWLFSYPRTGTYPILAAFDGGGAYECKLLVDAEGRFHGHAGEAAVWSNFAQPLQNWRLLTLTNDGSTASLYVNGTFQMSQATLPGSITTCTPQLAATSTSEPAHACFSEIAVYDAPLGGTLISIFSTRRRIRPRDRS